jgi:hypothetical protein
MVVVTLASEDAGRAALWGFLIAASAPLQVEYEITDHGELLQGIAKTQNA